MLLEREKPPHRHNCPLKQERGHQNPALRFQVGRYLVLAAAFFLRSAQRFFISSESLFRPAGLSLLAGFVRIALLLDALFVFRLVCVFELDAVRMLRAEVSLAISALISFTILAVSTGLLRKAMLPAYSLMLRQRST
jgi:hypothetical protein